MRFGLAKTNLIDRDDMQGRSYRPKNVTLIAAPWLFYNHVEFRSQQLGLGYVGGYAERYGHRITFIDPMLEDGHLIKQIVQTKLQETNRFGHPDAWIVDRIPHNTDVIGINAPFTDSRLALYPLVDAIKARYPHILVVIGGVLATSLPEQVLRECKADVVVKGEGEVAFSRILNEYPIEQIPGLVYRDKNGSIINDTRRSEQLKTVDQIPPPGYSFRPMDEYVRWSPRGDQADRTLSIISSRGCPFTCEFCSIPEKGQIWRPFTPERVLEEIRTAIDQWGVNHIEFEDDNFTLQEPRALAVLSYLAELRAKGYPFSCSFPNGIMIDKMTESLADLLVRAGADIIYLPVESGDTRVLISMDKPMAEHHLEKTAQVARWCVNAGLMVSCFFIVGYPGGRLNARHVKNPATMEQYRDYLLTHKRYPRDTFMRGEDAQAFENTLGFARTLRDIGVQSISPLIATPYPGTELYEVCDAFGWLAFEDNRDVLTTVSYAAVTPGRVQIDTPWCSQQEAFDRWQHMMSVFTTHHNVRKKDADQFATDAELRFSV